MRRGKFKKLISAVLVTAMCLSPLSAGSSMSAETVEKRVERKDTGSTYAFAAESVLAEEALSKDAKMQITIKRSGDVSEAAQMVLLSADINAEYGEDYTLTYNGKTIQEEDQASSMYAAFQDKRVISDYEEDNKAFVDALLSASGLSLEGENQLVPSEGLEEGEQEPSKDGETEKGLTDADAEGASCYDSLSTLDKIGAVSSRTLLSFAAGEKTKKITLTVKADTLVEYDESFWLGVVSPEADKYLRKHLEGIPDIPLKLGRDIAVTSVSIGDASLEKPECRVKAKQAEYSVVAGEDGVAVSFAREGDTETFSTVLLKKDGKAYGYFYFAPYQELQEAKLEAGNYEILAKQNCTIAGKNTITVSEEKAAAEKKAVGKKGTAAPLQADSADLNTVYAYDALPSGSQAENSQRAGKKAAKKTKAAAPTKPNGDPDWFPDWTDTKGVTETDEYIAYVSDGSNSAQSLFNITGDPKKGYASGKFITDPKKEHNGKNVYNTYLLNTSGFCSGTKTNKARAVTSTKGSSSGKDTMQYDDYDMTGIESVETRYYADDTHFNITLGVHGVAEQVYKDVGSKGIHDVTVKFPNKNLKDQTKKQNIYFQNDNVGLGIKGDGVEAYIVNAFKLNKRTYQIAVTNSNKLDYVTKSGATESVAAEKVSEDEYSYLTMGNDTSHSIALNVRTVDSYPMMLSGYQFLDKYGEVVKDSFVGTSGTSGQIRFTQDFIRRYTEHCYPAKRTGKEEEYLTFRIQPVMSKVQLEKFNIINGSKDSIYNPYRGELVLENQSKTLYQGDYAILSAKDVQEGYTFSGVSIRRRKAESADWQTIMQYADNSGKVAFHLDADYSDYELEPIFSGHEADTIKLSFANEESKKHGTLTADKKQTQDGQKVSAIDLVGPEEYQINSYVPLVAEPEEGYVTCWHSGYRTYFGNVFYYQMDGISKHNNILVEFIKESELQTVDVALELKLYENQVNLREKGAMDAAVPLTDMQVSTTSGTTYQETTNQEGKLTFQKFKGVKDGIYSMMLYQPGQNRYRYVQYQFTGEKSLDIRVPAFAGMSAYPDRVTARIDGTSSGQSFIDLTETGEVEVTVEVYRPDADTKLGAVGLSFYYEGSDGMTKKEYTIDKPDPGTDNGDSLGVYDTYTMKVPSMDIPNMSYLYVDVKSSYQVMQTQKDASAGEMMTVDCDTGYVNTGYKFKTPNESSELAIQEEVPELPGLGTTGEDVSIPFIGLLDFGFTAKNGAYFVRQNDPNTGTWYLLTGYNVVSTWSKTMTDRYNGATKTSEALKKAEAESRAAGDLNGGGSNLVTIPGQSVINIAPAISLKFIMKDAEDGGAHMIGFDAVVGLDELISYNAPFSIYGIPCYVNLTFNGEEFLEVHAGGNDFGNVGVENSILEPDKGTDLAFFLQAPNLDLTVKTGVGYNAFAGVYLFIGGNLKFNIEHSDKWKAGGYFYLKGGVGADLAVFSIEAPIEIPGDGNRAFGDDEARSHIHSATTTLSESAVSRKGIRGSISNPAVNNKGIEESLNDSFEAIDKKPVFKLSRDMQQASQDPSEGESGTLNKVLKPAGKNVKMQLLKLFGKRMMAITLADNGAPKDSLNYLGAVYAVSEDGGRTWENKGNLSESENLQWNVRFYKLKNKVLMTWSEGDLDHAVGEKLDASSAFDLKTVASALTAFDLRGRYFDLAGNPLGDSFTIASEENIAISSLDAVENSDGKVELYYERRAYQENAASLTELMTQEQTVCKALLDDKGRTGTEDKRFLIQGENGTKNYRITELKAFSHKGIEGQVVVLDADGKLLQETENGTETSVEDRQIYLRVVSDANGNIPAGTLVPVTEAGTCAQRISLIENGEHIYLFWNQEGSIVSLMDFLPTTQEQYDEWKGQVETFGNLGCQMLLADESSLTPDKEFRVAINQKGQGILLWKYSEGRQYSDDKLGTHIYAGMFMTDEKGEIASSGRPISINQLLSEINNLDVQILDDGQIIYGGAQLDGATMYESSEADAIAENVEEKLGIQITRADSEEYPLPGKEYTAYVTLWNNGMKEVDNLVLSASGALHGSASVAELIEKEDGIANKNLAAGEVRKLMLPVTAAASIQDGDEVLYTLSRNGNKIASFKDTVQLGAYMVPEEMASVVSIPGTDDYQISLRVMNKGNQSGTTAVHSYTYEQGVQAKEEKDTKTCDYQSETILKPGDTTEISYVMKDAACADDNIHMIGVQTGDGYGQIVEGMLPERIEAPKVDEKQPENNVKPPEQSAKPSTVTPPQKGDILTLGSKSTRAKYKVTSSKAVTYYKAKLPAGMTSAKVPDTIKISGKTYKVTAIASAAFKGNKKLKKITIGKNVTSIGAKAFYGDKKLAALKINSKKLNKIGECAFYGCNHLTAFTLKSKKLKKKSVKKSLKGSSIKSIKTTPSLRKKYKKYFTRKNAGKSVTIK